MSLSGGKGASRSSASTAPDQFTQQYVQQVLNAARGVAAGGPPQPDPRLGQAGDFYTSQMANAGVGQRALAGDAGAVASLSNPYQQQVIDASRAGFGALQEQTANRVNANATLAGAFGGSRAAVTQGAALAANTRDQAGMEAQLRSQGYGDAMNRAGALVNFGFGGAQGAAGVAGQQRANDLGDRTFGVDVMRGAMQGLPYGQRSTQRSSGWNAGFSGAVPFPSLFG